MITNFAACRRTAQIAGPVASVVLGFVCGMWLDLHSIGGGLAAVLAMLGLGLLLFSTVANAQAGWRKCVAPLVLFLYIVVVLAFEPFENVYSTADLLRCIACLVPIIVGSVVFPRRARWFEAAACWMILAAAVAALYYGRSSPYPVMLFHKIRY